MINFSNVCGTFEILQNCLIYYKIIEVSMKGLKVNFDLKIYRYINIYKLNIRLYLKPQTIIYCALSPLFMFTECIMY